MRVILCLTSGKIPNKNNCNVTQVAILSHPEMVDIFDCGNFLDFLRRTVSPCIILCNHL